MTELTTCKIRWVDSHGNPTPDENPAVGIAVYWRTESLPGTRTEKRYPICAAHLARMPRLPDVSWYPGTGRTVAGWEFEPGAAMQLQSTLEQLHAILDKEGAQHVGRAIAQDTEEGSK